MKIKKAFFYITNFLSILSLMTVCYAKAQAQDSSPVSYSCSIKASSSNDKRVFIDIQDQTVLLGQSADRYDLQPIFVGDHIVNTFGAQYRFMGSWYFDEEAQKNVFMIGLFIMAIDFNSKGQEHFWRPPKNDKLSTRLAFPLFEVESNGEDPAYLEIDNKPISSGNYNIRNLEFSCKPT